MAFPLLGNNHRQIVHTHVPWSLISINSYQSQVSDAAQLGGILGHFRHKFVHI